MSSLKIINNEKCSQALWAQENKQLLNSRGMKMFNVMGIPGSGKTSFIEQTILQLKERISIGVITGQMAGVQDAERFSILGVPVCLIELEQGGLLPAHQIHEALQYLCSQQKLDLIFVENIGNLCCPPDYDIGAFTQVVIVDVTAGQDIADKYPGIFKQAQVVVLSKTGLLPYTKTELSLMRSSISRINSSAHICELDSLQLSGFEEWIDILCKIV
ncbi:MAG: hydrogenase nickel incorporation protein HypB [Candidatus Omnitrophota bacterium]|jgi:hydrogenase nickel incorporation protein HypB